MLAFEVNLVDSHVLGIAIDHRSSERHHIYIYIYIHWALFTCVHIYKLMLQAHLILLCVHPKYVEGCDWWSGIM